MGRAGSVLMGIIMVAIMFVIFPIVMTSAHELQTEKQTQVAETVTTGAGETTADIVLGKPLWDDAINSVVSITSDNHGDTPNADAYTAATQTLAVAGLVASETRTLTVVYEADALTAYTGMAQMVAVAPLLLFVGVLGAMVFGLYQGFKG